MRQLNFIATSGTNKRCCATGANDVLRNDIGFAQTEVITSLPKENIKQMLLNKLSTPEIQFLNQETRFLELFAIVNNLS